MIDREPLRLKTGELAQIELYQPDGSPPPNTIDALWDMVIRPHDPWISRVETTYFSRMLRGELAQDCADQVYSIWIDERPASHATMLRARDNPRVGLAAFVITDSANRGKGLCTLLMERMMDDFWADGGEYALLATGNPVAHAIYERSGFSDYNGHVMRYLSDAVRSEDVDGEYFSHHGPATVRPGHWGDGARIAWLYAKPSPWFVKDYLEAFYDHPALVHTRCGSVLPSMMLNVEERGGGLWVLETEDKRLVGAATLTYFDRAGQASAPVVDFLVVPAYLAQAGGLLHAAIGGAETAGARFVRIHLASPDSDKMQVARDIGFHLEATLAGQFAAGDDRYDLHIYTYEL